MSEATAESILVVLLMITAVSTTLFVLAYLMSPFQRSPQGRGIFLFALAVAYLIDMTLWNHISPPTTLAVAFTQQVIGFGLSAIASTYMLYVLLRTQWATVRGDAKAPATK
jgi:uncharacterized membrane protein YczE